jgi:uncharacterized membrane protein
MSIGEQDEIIGRITRKLLWVLVPFVITVMGLQVRDHFAIQHKANESYVDQHYKELYKLTAELSTTLSEYIRADEREKDQIWKRIEVIVERMDKFAMHDVYRGETPQEYQERQKEYGLDFTLLI